MCGEVGRKSEVERKKMAPMAERTELRDKPRDLIQGYEVSGLLAAERSLQPIADHRLARPWVFFTRRHLLRTTHAY